METRAEYAPDDIPVPVRDLRTERRFFVDNTIIRDYGPTLGVYGIAVYSALCMHANLETQQCYPSHRTLADMLDCSVSKVKQAIRKLEELRLIETAPRYDAANERQTSNLYTLLNPPVPPGTTDTPPRYHEKTTMNNPHLEQSEREADAVASEQPPDDPPEKPTPITKKKEPPHEAVQIYRREFHTYPRKPTWGDIVSTVGEDPEHLRRWARVCHQWQMHGYYKFNIAGLVDCFHKGGVGENKGAGGSSTARKQATGQPSTIELVEPEWLGVST